MEPWNDKSFRTTGFPNCCTATIFYNFGGTATSGMNTLATNEKKLEKFLKEEMGWRSDGHLIVAITNSDQVVANRVLRKFGFFSSKWMGKRDHQNTRMRLWWKQC